VTVEAWGMASNIVSMILAIMAMWFAFYIYDKGKATDQSITNSLSKIEAQAESLQKLSGRWMDRLTRYVTQERPPGPLDQTLPELVTVLATLPQAITMQINQPAKSDPPEHLIEELLTCYIVIYYYTALTNFWAQGYLPDVADFDEKNEFHQLTKRVTDGSSQDFGNIARILEATDQQRRSRNSLAHMLVEARDLWGHHVRSVADIWQQKAKGA